MKKEKEEENKWKENMERRSRTWRGEEKENKGI